jgi:hypothetical protein
MVTDPPWQVTGTNETLTISPSVLVYGHKKFINEDLEWDALLAPENITTSPGCHSFVRNGHIEFLSDCTHELAGQTVALPELPEWCKS